MRATGERKEPRTEALMCFWRCALSKPRPSIQRSGLILSAIIGAFDASSLPFVIYSAIYRRHHVSLRTWFWLYMIVPAL